MLNNNLYAFINELLLPIVVVIMPVAKLFCSSDFYSRQCAFSQSTASARKTQICP